MDYTGYTFTLTVDGKVFDLPITPSELKIKIGSNNKVVTLINEGDINVLKSPALVEFEFDARFPTRKYPFSIQPLDFEIYLNAFTDAKVKKQPILFDVYRISLDGKKYTWWTHRQVAIEELEVTESADNGDDVIIAFKLKEYKPYGTKVVRLPSSTSTTTSTSDKTRGNGGSGKGNTSSSKEYVVKKGDCLWAIAKEYYGSGTKWRKIYDANKTVIENTAKKYRGGKGSSNGHWIYPNTKLIIPAL